MSSKLRDAIESLLDLLYDNGINEETVLIAHENQCLRESLHTDKTLDVLRKAKAVLAEPLRNCEVGTAEEQIERYRNFCKTYSSCRRCPCQKNNDITTAKCFANWSQMPYKGEVEKIK